MIYSYNLDPLKPKLGLNRRDFVSPFKALVLCSSTYKGSKLVDLMKLNYSSRVYEFMDDIIDVYAESTPTKKSSTYLGFEPVKICENDKACLFLMHPIEEDVLVHDVSFRIEVKEYRVFFQGVFASPSLLNVGLSGIIETVGEPDFALLENYIFIEGITNERILLAFSNISKWSFRKLQRFFTVVDMG